MLRFLVSSGMLVLGMTQVILPARSQEFPAKQPIKIVVAQPPGGFADTSARITADFLQRRLGQAVIVENRAGASGAIGAEHVFKSPSDGYTLLMAETSFAQVPAVRDNLRYKIEDFTYLVQAFTYPPLMMVSPKTPVSTVPELVAYMKDNPDKLRYGSTGIGASIHLMGVRFERATGVQGIHVPYTGIGPAYIDLKADRIEYIPGGVLPFLEGIKVIGSVGSSRHPAYPNLPTLDEVGIKNASSDYWLGLVAPPHLPKPVADRLIHEISAVLQDPEVIAKYQGASKIAPEKELRTGEAFRKQIIDTARMWKGLVNQEKIVIPNS